MLCEFCVPVRPPFCLRNEFMNFNNLLIYEKIAHLIQLFVWLSLLLSSYFRPLLYQKQHWSAAWRVWQWPECPAWALLARRTHHAPPDAMEDNPSSRAVDCLFCSWCNPHWLGFFEALQQCPLILEVWRLGWVWGLGWARQLFWRFSTLYKRKNNLVSL